MMLHSKMSIALFQLKLLRGCQFKVKISRICSLCKPLEVFLTQCWQNFRVAATTATTVKRITLTTARTSGFTFGFTFCNQTLTSFFPPLHEHSFQVAGQIHTSFRVKFYQSRSALDIVPRFQFSFLTSLINTSSISLPLRQVTSNEQLEKKHLRLLWFSLSNSWLLWWQQSCLMS